MTLPSVTSPASALTILLSDLIARSRAERHRQTGAGCSQAADLLWRMPQEESTTACRETMLPTPHWFVVPAERTNRLYEVGPN